MEGFPKDKKNVTIKDMVDEVTREDMKRTMQSRKQHSELEMIKYESLIKQRVEETSMEEVYTDSLN